MNHYGTFEVAFIVIDVPSCTTLEVTNIVIDEPNLIIELNL